MENKKDDDDIKCSTCKDNKKTEKVSEDFIVMGEHMYKSVCTERWESWSDKPGTPILSYYYD